MFIQSTDDLNHHKFFRHITGILINHPYRSELVSLHAAILTRGPNILSIGFNKPVRPLIVRHHAPHENFSLHAEVSAIRNANCFDLSHCKIFVARIYKGEHKVANSKPCQVCQNIMQKVGIKKAIFTQQDGHLGCLKI